MSAWNEYGRPYPWRDFDPDADLAFSFDFFDFVTNSGEGLTLASCTVENVGHGLLDITGPSIAGTEVTLRVKRSATEAAPGKVIPFTLRPVLSDGQRNDWTRLLVLRDG